MNNYTSVRQKLRSPDQFFKETREVSRRARGLFSAFVGTPSLDEKYVGLHTTSLYTMNKLYTNTNLNSFASSSLTMNNLYNRLKAARFVMLLLSALLISSYRQVGNPRGGVWRNYATLRPFHISNSTIISAMVSMVLRLQTRCLSLVFIFTLSGILFGQNLVAPISANDLSSSSSQPALQMRQEKVGESYNYTYFEISDDLHLVLRDDRLEFLRTSGEEDFSFLVFEGAKYSSPRPSDVVRTEQQALENNAMAKVLGADYMTVSILTGVRYSELYPGVDLIVEGVDNEVQLSFVAKSPEALAQVNLNSLNAKTEMVGSTVLHTSSFGELTMRPVSDGRMIRDSEGHLQLKAAQGISTLTLRIAAQ